jgi:hypothetical protein
MSKKIEQYVCPSIKEQIEKLLTQLPPLLQEAKKE